LNLNHFIFFQSENIRRLRVLILVVKKLTKHSLFKIVYPKFVNSSQIEKRLYQFNYIMKLKNFIYTLLILVVFAFITYRIVENKSNDSGSKDKERKNKPIIVNGIVVKAQTFDNNLSLSGSIEANEQVDIRSEVSGIVEGIYFKEGSNVSKGQLLFKVNDLELRAQLAQVNTKEGLAAENERRAKLLLQKEAISQEEYDIVKADFKLAKAQIQLIQAQIAKTSVRAPFSGKIGLRSISPGTYITPTILVAKLVNISQLKITFSVPEKYASQIKVNSNLSFTVTNGTKSYLAKVYAIEPEVEIATRTLQVRAITENRDGKLLPGIFADVELPLDIIKNAIVIPTEAIIPVQNGKKVFISYNGIAKEVMVETTTRTDASILVLSGLKVGDTLITTGVMSLKEETPVKVKIK
jgi:membrane fusion protein (multidrug efflux system)